MIQRLLLALCLLPATLFAQEYEAKGYSWEKEPEYLKLSSDEMKESSVTLKDKRIIEHIFEDDETLVTFETRHKVVRVNDDNGIEDYNKVYLPLHNVIDIIDLRARTVTKEGKVIEVEKDAMKELENVDEYGFYKIFAVEGLEEESTLEYFYTVKKRFTYFGRQFFQKKSVVKNASLQIISPSHLVFSAKGYNGFPQLEESKDGGKRFLKSEVNDIPILEDERYSAEDANLMRVEYKISRNTLKGNAELFSWADAAKRFYEVIYEPAQKNEKKLAKELKKIDLSGKDTEDKIRAIESHVKNNYLFQEYNPEGDDLGKILSSQSATPKGFVHLFAGLFEAAGITHELVLTTDRYDVRFDKEFQSWNYLDEYLFFFPGHNTYMAPDQLEMRYGMFPWQWANNYGLYIKRLEIGNLTTGVGDVRRVDCCPADAHYDNMTVDITFPEDMDGAKLKLKREFAGHNAMFIQPYYDQIPEEAQGTVVDELLQFVGTDAVLENPVVKNHNPDQSPLDYPFTLESDITVNSLLEKAGPNYLFKIGNVIGEQVEMYQEKKRQSQVEIEFPHEYKRTIRFTIPEGFTASGLDNLNFDLEYGAENNKAHTMGFVSSYTQTGNTVEVVVEEYYRNFNYPLDQFEEFRKVINAAADFNKVVVVFEKG